jgi:hypothetical protein
MRNGYVSAGSLGQSKRCLIDMSPPSSYIRCFSFTFSKCPSISKQTQHRPARTNDHPQAILLSKNAINMPLPATAVASPASSSSDPTSDNGPKSRRNRVSAEHTLNRVRENQRRHRARQRDHVASLEEKLAETEKLLEEAKAEIAALKEEAASTGLRQLVCQTKNGGALRYEKNGPGNPTSMEDIHASSQQGTELAFVQPHANLDPQLDYPDVRIPDLSFLGDPSYYLTSSTDLSDMPTDLDRTPNIAGPPPCCSDTPSPPPPDELVDLQCSSCKTRPPPAASESTTLCSQAYVMIGQQNFRNLDPDTIRLWLAQGLRRAQREGEGCRVENGALMRLLDFISGL